jgi:hypothetical protein
VVNISANAAASGYTFDDWIGNTSGIANVNASSTTLTMPAANQTITATYEEAGDGPSINSTSGTWSHGNSVTISGGGFGSKSTAAPVVWDDCSSGTYPTDAGWSGYWPNHGESSYYLHYTTPIRGIGLPHGNISRYMAGCHGDDEGYWGGYNVMCWKTRTISSFPSYTYASWYARADDNWVFNLGNPPDNNFKCYDYSYGGEPYCMNDSTHSNWYASYGPPNPSSTTSSVQWVINDDGGSMTNPDANDHNYWWDSATNPMSGVWVKLEMAIKFTDHNGDGGDPDNGYIKLWDNGALRIDYEGPTDRYAGTSRVDAIGGYIRDSGNSNQWRYFADLYLDHTLSRVVLANASTLSNATIVEPQIPSSWGSSSITVTVNEGKLTGNVHVFVVDADGNVSGGYQVGL